MSSVLSDFSQLSFFVKASKDAIGILNRTKTNKQTPAHHQSVIGHTLSNQIEKN